MVLKYLITTAAFKRACDEGKTSYRYGRIMVTGKYGDGKTSLINALLGKPIPEEHVPTDGLDAKQSCKVNIIRCTEDWLELSVEKAEMVYDNVAYAIIDCEKEQQTQIMDTKPLDTNSEKELLLQSADQSKGEHLDRPANEATFQDKKIDQKLFERVNEKKQAVKGTPLENKAVIFMWDFGGQEVYKNLHPIFLRTDCVHIVVYDLEKLENTEKNEELKNYSEEIEFWLQMILSNRHQDDGDRSANVLLVGTHKDKDIFHKTPCH